MNTKAARDAARDAGEPYGNIFTTTAGYLNSKEGKYVHEEIYSKSMRWTELLYDCIDIATLHKTIRKNSPGKKISVLLEFNHRQLGYTDEWLRGKIEDAMASGDAVLADFLNVWVEGSETSAIDKNLLKMLMNSVMDDPFNEISESGYITRWYIPQHEIDTIVKHKETILVLDTSDAVGSDDIAMVIRDVRTGGVIAAGQYNETNLITFSEWIIEWIENFPKMTVVIERRSSGVSIIDNLLKILPAKGIDPFKRIFNWIVDDLVEYPDRAKETFLTPLNRRHPDAYVKYRKYFGFATSGGGRTARDNLYGNNLLSSIKYTGSRACDKNLVEQIASLTIKNGRLDHRSGSHDDLVIAWVLGYWFLTTARNKEYYGISSSIVLSVVINEDMVKDGSKEKMEQQRYQIALKEQIDTMLEKLRTERDHVRNTLLTNKIRHLSRDIDTKYIQSFNIENVLENILLEKRKKKYY